MYVFLDLVFFFFFRQIISLLLSSGIRLTLTNRIPRCLDAPIRSSYQMLSKRQEFTLKNMYEDQVRSK